MTLTGPDGSSVNVDLARMVVCMLNPDPDLRPTPSEIIKEPYMQTAIHALLEKKRDILAEGSMFQGCRCDASSLRTTSSSDLNI